MGRQEVGEVRAEPEVGGGGSHRESAQISSPAGPPASAFRFALCTTVRALENRQSPAPHPQSNPAARPLKHPKGSSSCNSTCSSQSATPNTGHFLGLLECPPLKAQHGCTSPRKTSLSQFAYPSKFLLSAFAQPIGVMCTEELTADAHGLLCGRLYRCVPRR